MASNEEVLATGVLTPNEVRKLEFDLGQHIIGQHVCVQKKPLDQGVQVNIVSNGMLLLHVVYNLLSLCLQEQCRLVEEDDDLRKYGWGSVIRMNNRLRLF